MLHLMIELTVKSSDIMGYQPNFNSAQVSTYTFFKRGLVAIED